MEFCDEMHFKLHIKAIFLESFKELLFFCISFPFQIIAVTFVNGKFQTPECFAFFAPNVFCFLKGKPNNAISSCFMLQIK